MTQDAPLLEARDIAFSYGKRRVFDGASLVLRDGEKVGIHADNGMGKTTLLRLLTGLEKRSGGELLLRGRPVSTEKDFQALRRTVAFVLQNPDDQIFFPVVLEDASFGPLNLGLPREEAESEAMRALALLHIEHLAKRRASELSGGQKRLVSIACMLAMRPSLLLLDEPTTGLDAAARGNLTAVLRGLAMAELIVSHNDAFLADVASRCLSIEAGRLVPLDIKALR